MVDFASSASFVWHETTTEHTKLMFKQAMGEDNDAAGRERTEKRNFLSGVEDVPAGKFEEDG
jgi:hypothetical protein